MEKVGTYDLIMSSLAENVPNLTEEERCQLEEVMKKAKEFDAEEENKTKKPIEGQLFKYTNVVKGWQFRWFVLTPEVGMLEYYMPDETRKTKPRGGLHLAGAVITSNDEDDLSFSVSALSGEVYKLKAADAKDRQFWVNRLNTAVDQLSGSCTEEITSVNKVQRSHSFSQREPAKLTALHEKKSPLTKANSHSVGYLPQDSVSSVSDSLIIIKSWLDKAALLQRGLANLIEDLPIDGKNLKCSDTSLLLLKATSKATIQSIEECYHILRQKQLAFTNPRGLPPGATIEWVDTSNAI